MTGTKRELFADILGEAAVRHGLTIEALTGPRRLRPIAWARQEVMAEAWRRTSLSKCEIGRRLGGRCHGAVIHGIRAHLAREAGRAGE
jgi:chromosomal replication initiation ATPase DnaA